jgi:hypothetical protein
MEWMPENPYPESIPTFTRHMDFEKGCQQTAREIAEWGTEICFDPKHSGCISGYRRTRFHCLECIEQLRKEVKEGE